MTDINNNTINWKQMVLNNNDFINGILNHKPFKNQLKFLIYPAEEILYGGGAGSAASRMHC